MRGDSSSSDQIADLQNQIKRLKERLDRQKDLGIRLKETLHSLKVHEEELRTQNEDLIAAQMEISVSQRKYRDLFDFAPIGYFLVDANGAILEANLTASNMLGRHRDNLSGKPLLLYIEESYRNTLRRHLREIWEGRPATAEILFLKKNADTVPVELFSVPVLNETQQVNQGRVAVSDISRRWQAEDALKESERKLASIVNTIPDIIYRLDQNGMIDFISEGIQRYGYLPQDLLGQPIKNLVHPEDWQAARHQIAERRTGDRSTDSLELRLVAGSRIEPSEAGADNRDSYFMVKAEGLYATNHNTDDNFLGTQGIAHDITGRKESETEKMRLEAELNKARRMEAIGTLAGGIAHDFNNLLMGIQGNLSLMRLDISKPIETSSEQLESIEACVKRGSELTRQLLGFAKGGKYNVQSIDIDKIVRDTVQMFAYTRKSIQVDLRAASKLPSVEADQSQLEQVLLNLLINAEQAMPDGGQISIKTEQIKPKARQLKRLGLDDGKYVRISIKDSGIGMNKKTQRRIFEPFFTTKEVGQGTGLGLASAYGIIRNHGGMIDVTSTLGRGSRFSIYLPASNSHVAAKRAPAPGVLKGSGTLLLIDDEDMILKVGRKMIDRLGYRVITARGGAEAVAIYKERFGEIRMVILDLIMPQMSGFEVYQHLKEINPAIKVLLASGYSDRGQAGEIVARDRQEFVQKPFDLAKLSQKIWSVLNRQ